MPLSRVLNSSCGEPCVLRQRVATVVNNFSRGVVLMRFGHGMWTEFLSHCSSVWLALLLVPEQQSCNTVSCKLSQSLVCGLPAEHPRHSIDHMTRAEVDNSQLLLVNIPLIRCAFSRYSRCWCSYYWMPEGSIGLRPNYSTSTWWTGLTGTLEIFKRVCINQNERFGMAWSFVIISHRQRVPVYSSTRQGKAVVKYPFVLVGNFAHYHYLLQ